jgi:hypothetical protein
VTNGAERTRWKIRSDRLVDETPQVRLSIASLELASGFTFEQYVMRLPQCAMTVVLDDAAERILLIWRRWPTRPRRSDGSRSLSFPR